MIKAAIFDVDGTLLDTMPFWATVGSRMIGRLGFEPVEQLDENILFMTLEESCAFIKKTYNLSESVTEIKEAVVKEVADYYLHEAKAKNGMPELLQYFKDNGIKMAIATAGDKRLVRAAFIRLGLDGYFEEIFTCSELDLNKESADIYLHAASALGSSPNETAVFEDILRAVRSAKSAGFITVAIEDSESECDREEIKLISDFYVSTREEILDIREKL